MARNTLKLDTSGIERLLIELDSLGGNVKQASELALKEAAVQIQNDTVLATSPPKLPAGGQYSKGYTDASIIHFPKVEWDGNTAWVGVGFDFAKPGSGGYLIEGTPRMQPDKDLREKYKGKRYMSTIQKQMQEKIWEKLKEKWGV